MASPEIIIMLWDFFGGFEESKQPDAGESQLVSLTWVNLPHLPQEPATPNQNQNQII